MKLKTLSDIDLKGKRVIFRTAYDVPIIQKRGRYVVEDPTRISITVKTLKFLLQKKCKIVILTWLGRPGGKKVDALKLDPVARTLEELIKKPVKKLSSISGSSVQKEIETMKEGDIIMLENVRFSPQEEHHDDALAATLASYGDCVVFDAFAQSHRDFPSTTGILSRLPSVCGYDMVQEVTTLHSVLEKPKFPFVVVLGGAKISDKIELITNLMKIADAILIGGALSHNFLKASGIKIAASLVEGQSLDLKKHQKRLVTIAEEIIHSAKGVYLNLGKGMNIPKLVLPLDLVATPHNGSSEKTRVIDLEGKTALPWNWMYMDIGPKTEQYFSEIIMRSKTVFWNGPLGYVESPEFEKGTLAIAQTIAKSKCKSIIGGGDTEAFLREHKLSKSYDYISTGGGAALQFMSGIPLPVLKYLVK